MTWIADAQQGPCPVPLSLAERREFSSREARTSDALAFEGGAAISLTFLLVAFLLFYLLFE